MKNILLILCVSILVSCKEESSKNSINMEYAVEDEIFEMDGIGSNFEYHTPENNHITETFKYQELTTEKLQEFLDLIALQQKHPEFRDDIKQQLKNYTNDSLSNYKTVDDAVIKNIELKGNIISLNDTTEKMKLTYDLLSNNNIKQDSIWVEITTSTIDFDGNQMQSRKIIFSKIK